ncbi:MAG TPA: hypothetical protein DDY70_02625 [Clostridiales bacterium]|nr:hypothetical protein [Clostridiales bacterium]
MLFLPKKAKNKDDDGKNEEKQVIPDIFRRTVLSLDKSAKKKYNILKNKLFVCRLDGRTRVFYENNEYFPPFCLDLSA